MKTHSRNMSTRSLLLIVYFIMTVTALMPIYLGIASFSEHIEMIESLQGFYDEQEIASHIASHNHQPVSLFGELIHSILGVSNSENESSWVSHSKQIRTGMFGACVLTLAFSLIFATWLNGRMKKPVTDLANTISQLAQNNIKSPIMVYGSRDLQTVRSSLEMLRRRLLQSDNQLKQSLQHISHEIKTPLTSIKEGTQLLDEEFLGSINSEQREIIDILKKSTQELQNSIEKLLDYNSAISAKQINLRETVNLNNVINKVIDKHALSIKTKQLTIQRDTQPFDLRINHKQIITVIDNLLSNAIKFSPKKGIIQIILSRTEYENIFTIIDQGPGVSIENERSIFDPFFVGDQAKHSTLKGTGLGLSISKQLIEAHSGSLELLNTTKGAAFRFILKSGL